MKPKAPIAEALDNTKTQLINQAIEARKAGNAAVQDDTERRMNYISRLITDLGDREDHPAYRKRVFISYSSNTGSDYSEYIESQLRAVHHFDVVTGFSDLSEDDEVVLDVVLRALRTSSLFLGIFTKEYPIVHGGHTTWAPSVWTIEEKGMALALGLPFVLLVEEGVDEDYWKKTTPADRHFIFSKGSFHATADSALKQVSKKHTSKLVSLFQHDRTGPARSGSSA